MANLAALAPRKRTAFIAACLLSFSLLVLLQLTIATPQTTPSAPVYHLRGPAEHSFDGPDCPIHLLVIATETNVELCKGLLSASLLGYSPPMLVNWGTKGTKGSNIGKITGPHELLNTWDDRSQDDLVMVVDGFDLWFQLPPSILRQRYINIRRRLDSRSVELLGSRTVDAESLQHSIIFSAQKNCDPRQRMETGCYAAPEALTRKDLYGNLTDVRMYPSLHLSGRMRPMFINAGFVIGTVGTMKPLLERAREKVIVDGIDHRGSDQYVFQEVFGQQQYWRELRRQYHRSIIQKVLDVYKQTLGTLALMTDPHPFHKPANVTARKGDKSRFEYSMGLDYNLELSQARSHADEDGVFVVYADEAGKQQTLRGPDMPVPPRVQKLPADIANDISLPDIDWAQQFLYTNVYTSAVPVTLHFNGDKGKRKTVWKEMWFFGTARERFFATRQNPGIAKDPEGNVLRWNDICQQFEEKIF